MTDWCPWLIRRKGKTWLCKIENDVCSNHEHYLLCTRYALAMKIIADPLSQELINNHPNHKKYLEKKTKWIK